ncbi:hypothetical protein SLEP1_g43275 [Rubroshorea leprosula]|uniref:Uncharacterized protein n=2 Tax=Rubroshorea leprosula TaxID=152421 RepID=A0AAV5LCG6_9ROSI|nr:hypothetical protein SLEP1_g43275 [Rubroshorea leprosula]
MTEVLHFPSSPSTGTSSPSSPSPPPISCAPQNSLSCGTEDGDDDFSVRVGDPEEEVKEREKQSRDQLSLLALLVTVFRKSLAACKSDRRELCAMEIGWPTNVRHVVHVTFDRFNGFLGLPVEFEPEVSRRAPSASTTVFGVSTESMQLSYDSRGNSVPTILLLMQRRLYAQGGLQAEGIFRINAENSQEEYVRDQLNSGVVPEGIDVHCLAGLIKAWFRELPTGVLDSLSPEQVMQCQTDEQCAELVRHLPPTEAALLDWTINLMADVVEHEHLNKMNARNIAMVFAPNMTQMADPLTALMYAVQVMNFLKMLILRTLREREDSVVEPTLASRLEPSDENEDHSHSQSFLQDAEKDNEGKDEAFIVEEPVKESSLDQNNETSYGEYERLVPSVLKLIADADLSSVMSAQVASISATDTKAGTQAKAGKSKIGQSSNSSLKRGPRKTNRLHSALQMITSVEKTKDLSNLSRIDSGIQRIEAWR